LTHDGERAPLEIIEESHPFIQAIVMAVDEMRCAREGDSAPLKLLVIWADSSSRSRLLSPCNSIRASNSIRQNLLALLGASALI
jgi:hypothetical protein